MKALLAQEPQTYCDKLWTRAIAWFHQAAVAKDPNVLTMGTLKFNGGIKAVRLQDHNANVAELITIEPEPKTVGLVYADGTMKLAGQSRDTVFWNTPDLWIDMAKIPLGGRVGVKLIQNALKLANASDMRPALRQWAQKLNGKGLSAVTLDVMPEHAQMVSDVMNHPDHGIAPGLANQVNYSNLQDTFNWGVPNNLSTADLATLSVKKLKDGIAQAFQQHLNTVNHQLETVLKQPKPWPVVVNISQTCNTSNYYKKLDELANSPALKWQNLDARHFDPNLIDYLKQAQSSDTIASAQATVNLVDQIILSSPDVAQALARYQALTRALTQRGTLVVVGAGNEDQVMPTQVKSDPACATNWLTKSHDIVHVAGSYTNGQPWHFNAHQPAGFSNTAGDKAYPPTLAAPAVLIPVESKQWGISRPSFTSGTSFAAPFVAGVIALMKQANPALTAEQIKDLLSQSCENPNGHAKSKVGAGYLNPMKAVRLAANRPV